MLNQRAFEAQYERDWVRLEFALDSLESRKFGRKRKFDNSDLPTLYAALCQHHSTAQNRGYSHALNKRLHDLITRAHHQLYQHRGHVIYKTIEFLGGGFAKAVREQWKLLALSSALFFIIAFICGALSAYSVDFADLFMGGKQRFSLEKMYEPGTEIRPAGKESESSFLMFGFYIMNNISIDFRMFASGILYGVGTVFFLVFNGVQLGAAAGHLTGIGYTETFWGFVAGHSAPELIAMCISGAAGLMLGQALIRPGRQTRVLALKRAASKAVPLIVGAGLMTLFAAFIEAYWSSKDLAFGTKITVGLIIWVLHILYLSLAGRERVPPNHG